MQALALARDGFFDGGMGVAERGDADAAEQIEVVVAVLVAEVDALSADKETGVAFVGLEKQFVLRCLDRCQVHATMTSVPSLTRVEQRSGNSAAASAGRIRTRLTPWVRASRQALSLGNMPPETTCCLFHGGDLCEGEPAHDVAVGSFDAGYVGEKDERVGLGADGAGGGHLVGVDVVVLAVEAERDRRDDGDGTHRPDGFEPARIGGGDLADEAEVGVGLLLAGAKDVAVAAGETDGGLAVGAEGCDERFVDAAGENHQRGVAGLGVGDAQAGDELALLAHLCEGARQLHTAAVDDGDLVAVGDQLGDGLAARVQQLLVLEGGAA